MSFTLVILKISAMTAMMVVGLIAAKVGVLKEEAVGVISALVMNITLPCNILAIVIRPFNRELLPLVGLTFIVATIYYILSLPLSGWYSRLIGIKGEQAGPHRCSFIFSNVGFMGFPIALAFFTGEILFLVVIWNIVFYLFLLNVAPIIFTPNHRLSFNEFIKNPAIIASALGLLAFFFSLPVPEIIMENLALVGGMTTPLSMIFIGLTLAKVDFTKVLLAGRVWLTSLVRLVIWPFICFFPVHYLIKCKEITIVAVLVLGLPVAALTSILAEKYESDVELASQLVFLSSVISMLTLPILIYLLQSL